MAVVAGWVAVALAASSAVSSEIGRRATNDAAEVDAKRVAVSNRKDRIKALSKARVDRATQVAGAEVASTGSGSGAAGAIGSTQSQTFSNVGFQQQMEAVNARRLGFMNEARNFSSFAKSFNSLSSIASLSGGGTGNAAADLGKTISKNGTNFSNYFKKA